MSIPFRPGDVIAEDYRVVRKIASGGMGVVYEVEQRSTGRRRALKALASRLVEDEKSRARFESEARIVSRIESDHVVQVYAAGIHEPGSIPWIVMELLRGEDLKSYIKRMGALSVHDTLEIFEQIGHALALAHAQQIIHFDLKPENLFRSEPRGHADRPLYKILDFGIAKVATESGVEVTSALGSPYWLAPEQLKPNTIVYPNADVWPLGLIAFFLLTGQRYWNTEGSVAPLLMEIFQGELEAPSLRAASRGLPVPFGPAFDAWFMGCVERDPERRIPNAAEAVAALRTALTYDRPGAHGGPLLHPAEEEATVPGELPGESEATLLGTSPFAASGYEAAGYEAAGYEAAGYEAAGYDAAGGEASLDDGEATLMRPSTFGRSSDPNKPLPPLAPPQIRPSQDFAVSPVSAAGAPAGVAGDQVGTGPTEEIIGAERRIPWALVAIVSAVIAFLLIAGGGGLAYLLLRNHEEPLPEHASPPAPAPTPAQGGGGSVEASPPTPPPAGGSAGGPAAAPAASPAEGEEPPTVEEGSGAAQEGGGEEPGAEPGEAHPEPDAREMARCINTKERRIRREIQRHRRTPGRLNEDLIGRVARIDCYHDFGQQEEELRAMRSFLHRYPSANVASDYRQRLREAGR